MSYSFEAWHGSRYGDCDFMAGGNDSGVAWFSFHAGEAEVFARQAAADEALPTLCKVRVEGSRYSLFDGGLDLPEEDVRNAIIECLKEKGASEYWLDDILGSMENYDFIAYDPDGGGTDSALVAECVKELGYIGWLERESHLDTPENFALFDPHTRVTVLEVFVLCPDCGSTMGAIDDVTYECDSCEAEHKVCGVCATPLEFDEDDEEWFYANCNCDAEGLVD
jgi:hypothetical protein